MEDEGVIVMPGSGFGAGGEGFFSISFIVSPARLREAAVACRPCAFRAAAAGVERWPA